MEKNINFSEFLSNTEKSIRTIYIASYIPRRCGIATFTKDLITAINPQNPDALAEIIAINDDGEQYDYPWEVKFRINQTTPEDYISAAHYINQSSADIINLQHEFGLYGGVDGDYILPMIDVIHKPLVTCFHSILPEPDEHKRYIMKRIIDKSSAVIAMTTISRQLLIDVYGCPPDKAVVIYHGVPDFAFEDSTSAKKYLNINASKLLLMSGLLGPGKGIEYVIEAMPEILKQNPETKFYILGQTHPSLIKNKKDEYRDKLTELTKKLNIESQIVFVNKYLDLNELIDYYKAADVYLTPHLDPQQPTSGTLAYALGAGKICVSTPYNYAKEVLANETGILIKFHDAVSISEEINKVFSDPVQMQKYRTNAYNLGKKMQWPRVAKRYLNLFNVIMEIRRDEKSSNH